MKPIIILPPDTMSKEDMDMLRANELCVVVAADTSKVKFVDPIPAASNRTQIEQAAIGLSRILLNKQWGAYTTDGSIGVATFSRIYIDLLLKGTPLDKNPSREEIQQHYFDHEKMDELRRLAREEARAERAALKQAEKEKKEAKKLASTAPAK